MKIQKLLLSLLCAGTMVGSTLASPPPAAPVNPVPPAPTSGSERPSGPEQSRERPGTRPADGKRVPTLPPLVYYVPDPCDDSFTFQSSGTFKLQFQGKRGTATGDLKIAQEKRELQGRDPRDETLGQAGFGFESVDSPNSEADLVLSVPETGDAGKMTKEERERARERIRGRGPKETKGDWLEGLVLIGMLRFDDCTLDPCARRPHKVEIEIHVKVLGSATITGKDSTAGFSGRLRTYDAVKREYGSEKVFSFDRKKATKDDFLFEEGKLLATIQFSLLEGASLPTYELQILPELKGGNGSTAEMTLHVEVSQSLVRTHCPTCGHEE